MSIERVAFDDAEALRLRAEIEAQHDALYGADSEPGPPPSAEDMTVFLLVRDGAAAIGCGGLREADGEAVELKRMYVRPEARRRGVGRRLLAALEDEARALGARRVLLETGDAQREAVALYERAGYRRVPCFKGHARSLCYERVLTPAA